MKPFITYTAIALLALSVEAAFLPSVSPDIVLVLVCSYALRYGRLRGVVYACTCGFVLDSIQGILIGPNILSKSLAAYYIRMIRENIIHWNIFIHLVLMSILSIMDIILVRFIGEYFSDILASYNTIGSMTKEVLFTVTVSLLLYPICRINDEAL